MYEYSVLRRGPICEGRQVLWRRPEHRQAFQRFPAREVRRTSWPCARAKV